MISINDLETADSAVFTIKNVRMDDDLIGDDGQNPVTVELYSPGSAQGQKALHKERRTSQPRMWRWMRNEFLPTDAADQDRERAEKLAAITKSVNNLSLRPIDIYLNPKANFFTRQIETLFGNDANFAKGSSAGTTPAA